MKFIQKQLKGSTNDETNLYYIDNIWSLDILDLKDYGPQNKRNYGKYGKVLVVIDNFSKNEGTVPLKNRNVQTKTNSLEKILKSSKISLNLIETDRGKEFLNSIFTDLLKRNIIKDVLKTFPTKQYLTKSLTLLSGSFSKTLFLNEVLAIGLMFFQK